MSLWIYYQNFIFRCQAIQNLGLAVSSILSGMIVDAGGYYSLELFFIGSLYVSLFAAIAILMIDVFKGGVLNMTPKQRDEYSRSTM